jgi:hypothetical protein
MKHMLDEGGRHLGYICDSCGAVDFPGYRYKCAVCFDYDLCAQCHGQKEAVTHRWVGDSMGVHCDMGAWACILEQCKPVRSDGDIDASHKMQ